MEEVPYKGAKLHEWQHYKSDNSITQVFTK